ncbi:family 1 glycosylhydrolase [Gordonia mangrovi]|uniref:family 1 glycosylhydrolase n=1 Tax=Gordonia mangrovi TaxID=2665643 RepID=UPI0021ACCFD8|nr:family 1 glycosylhydrolase [Gordonia mangrovi]UVF78419.1 family 1 glycosylhydrolase [Gordonia mangrovi]
MLGGIQLPGARRVTWLAAVVPAIVVVLATSVAAPAGAGPAPTPLPGDFVWGVSSSGFQSEGSSPDSNWRRYAMSGRTHDRVGTSVDFRHRYRDDIARAARLGVGVYRVGVEWARIEPRPGVIDHGELTYYDDVIATIVAAGMRPMITLDHWVYPGWIADRGGWADPATPARWLRNARRVVDRYARFHPYWITINEPFTYATNEIRLGAISPAAVPAMVDRLVTVHRAIYRHIHRRDPAAMVSSNVAYIPTVEPLLDTRFLDRVADSLDFIGIDYYYSVSPGNTNAWHAATDEQWLAPVAADGLYYALRDYARRYPDMPLYVVESGMPTRDGAQRPDGYRRGDHLRDLVYWLQRARGDGVDVIGYNYWSLTDNYEWGSYTPRFGLYSVDVTTDPTLTRRPTDAVAAYRRITATNGVPTGYRPSRPAEFCSLVAAPSSCLEPVR